MKTKFLIAGATGQLGKAFCSLLEKRGETYVGFSRRELDITNFSQVRERLREIQPEIVINCAAFTDVEKAEDDFLQAIFVNGVGCKNLAIVSSSVGAVFVTFSTDYVFDGRKRAPYTIADIPNPLSCYGRSKLLGESLTRDFSSKFFIVRTSWLFGESENNFVKKFFQWIKEKDVLRISEDRFSTPSYTVDVAGAVLDLIHTENYGLYHITNAGWCSRYQMSRYIATKLGWRKTILPIDEEELEMKAERPFFSVLDNFPLKETIGYTLRSWEEALEAYLESLKQD